MQKGADSNIPSNYKPVAYSISKNTVDKHLAAIDNFLLNAPSTNITSSAINAALGTTNPRSLLQLKTTGETKIILSGYQSEAEMVVGSIEARNEYGHNDYVSSRIDFITEGDAPWDKGAISFRTKEGWGGAFTEKMRINSQGNIGAGKTNPEYKFDINGDIRINNSLFLGTNTYNSIGTDNSSVYYSATGSQYFSINSGIYNMVLNGYGLSINNSSNGNGSGVGLVVGTGNVGIGVINPFEKCHVVGNGLFTGSVSIGSYTMATRPTQSAGKMIYVTDGSAGNNFQGSNGTTWLPLG